MILLTGWEHLSFKIRGGTSPFEVGVFCHVQQAKLETVESLNCYACRTQSRSLQGNDFLLFSMFLFLYYYCSYAGVCPNLTALTFLKTHQIDTQVRPGEKCSIFNEKKSAQ